MKLVIGLGNPGNEYKNTRHNIGFMYLDYILGDDVFHLNKKFNAYECEKVINEEKILFVKPLSYMNLSGEIAIKYMKYYKITGDNLLIIQDDLDLPVGRYKLMYNRGDGGHNGIKNIFLNVKSRGFLRLKIGISNNKDENTKDYVLGKFSSSELDIIFNQFERLKDFISDYVSLNRSLLMGKYNTKNK